MKYLLIICVAVFLAAAYSIELACAFLAGAGLAELRKIWNE